MASWQLQEAKARFSEVVNRSRKRPQIITRRGVQTAVVMSFDEWSKLTNASATNQAGRRVGDLTPQEREESEAWLTLLQSGPDFELPKRSRIRLRKPVEF